MSMLLIAGRLCFTNSLSVNGSFFECIKFEFKSNVRLKNKVTHVSISGIFLVFSDALFFSSY